MNLITKNKKIIFLFFIVYLITIISYYFLSINLGNTPLFLQMRRFIPATLAFIIPFLFLKKIKYSLFSTSLITSILCGLTSPILVYLTYHNTATYLSLPYDFSFGLYIFPFLIFLSIILIKILKINYTIANSIITLIHTLLIIPPIFQIFYFIKFNHCLTEKGTMAIYQTNFTEAIEYISSIGILLPLSLSVIVSIIYVFYKKTNIFFQNLNNIVFHDKQKIILLLLFSSLSVYLSTNLYYKTYFYELAISTNDYFQSIKLYRDGRNDILNNLTVQKNNTQQKPHTIFIVIGESATRNYMSSFTEMSDNTTPWLSENKNNSNFIIFQNAYSCEYSTGPTLSHALTESSYYNNKPFYESISFIDIAKKAGYKTYWFSNQGIIGAADTPITLVAETAEYKKWVSQDNTANSQYDEELINYLKYVNPNENNLVVLHIMGSHIDYNNRYPTKFQKWTDPGETGRLADYKNSLLYTDNILQKIFEYGKTKLNLDAMIYFSDHGNDPNRSRDPDSTKFIFLRIPMFIYYSDNYKKANPTIVNNIAINKDKYFSNDLLYDFVCGVLNITSNHYDETQSLSSNKYMYDSTNLRTGAGKRSIKEDPYL